MVNEDEKGKVRRTQAPRGGWKLGGYDTFAGEWYEIPGSYPDEEKAQAAAQEYLKLLEKTQPSQYSGGQEPYGIQDRVYVIGPDGRTYRCCPKPS